MKRDLNEKCFAGALALVSLWMAGCGGGSGGPETVPVSGTVTLNGTPLADADIYFSNGTFAGFGKTDSQGHYQLVQGAVVGENRVHISKIEGDTSQLDPEAGIDMMQLQMAAEGAADPMTGAPPADAPKELVPPEYSDPASTKLQYIVPDGGSDAANFDL